jgi:hypothetical protein
LGLCLLRQVDRHGHHDSTAGVKDNRVSIANREALINGRPASCRPNLFASQTPHYFPLSAADRSKLLTMYPAGWKGQ